MKNKIKTYRLTVILLTLVLTVSRFVAMTVFYDAQIGYFNQNFFTSAITALFVLSGLWCLSPLVLVPRNQIGTQFTPNTVFPKAASAFSAVLFIFAAFSTFLQIAPSKIELATAIFTAISAFFFIFSIATFKSSEKARAFISIALAIALVLTLATIYFDMKVAMNSPHKIAGIFAIMSAMILTLCETRTYLGAPLPRLHFASALLTFLIGASTAVSSVIYVATANPTAFASTPILLGNGGNIAVIVGISAYALARCFTFENDLKEKETEV